MYLVVGSGLCGATMAERIATVLREDVLVLERRPHIGGNLYDYKDENGITVHKYGPHAFHTNDRAVWDYLSYFTEWEPYFHRVEAFIDGQDVPLPFNFNSIALLLPEQYAQTLINTLIDEFGAGNKVSIQELLTNPEVETLARFVYEKVFLGYTRKQWGLTPEELDISVAARVPIVLSRDNRYFHDTYQAIPSNGYSAMIKKQLDSPRIQIEHRELSGNDLKRNFKKIIYTGTIDAYFDNCLGPLPYRSLRFDLRTVNTEFYQATAQKNYPDNFDFTRSTEFKHFLREKSPVSTIAFEYPEAYTGANEPYYPVPTKESAGLYAQYASLARKEKNTIFLGRLAEYKYYNMDQAVRSALDAFKRLRDVC